MENICLTHTTTRSPGQLFQQPFHKDIKLQVATATVLWVHSFHGKIKTKKVKNLKIF